MSAMAVAVIGGPLTMGFLALETTGQPSASIAVVLAACVVSSLTVRRTFGYSFATWRFHLRGEAIRSAVDIGWMRNLTVGRMMRRGAAHRARRTLAGRFPPGVSAGSVQRVVALEASRTESTLASILVAEAHAEPDDARQVKDLLYCTDTVLLPQMTVKEAIALSRENRRERRAGGDRRGGHAPRIERCADRALRVSSATRRSWNEGGVSCPGSSGLPRAAGCRQATLRV